MDRYIHRNHVRSIVKITVGMFGGFLFGLCFLSGLAFLAGLQVYYETSDSMSPVIRKGSLLFVKKEKEYAQGDIVVFGTEKNGQTLCVTHRIVKKISAGYLTKGDANDRIDQNILSVSTLSGKVVGTIPCYGFFCYLMQQNQWLFFLYVVGGMWNLALK